MYLKGRKHGSKSHMFRPLLWKSEAYQYEQNMDPIGLYKITKFGLVGQWNSVTII